MHDAPPAALHWRTAQGMLHLEGPVVVGIVNVTPDSFHDGGRHATTEAAVRHAARLVEEGAGVLDVGGESTRPGAAAVDAATEARRVVPVVRELRAAWPAIPVSIDTVKADVAREAVAAGAAVINDVSGLRLDPAMAGVAARTGAGLILMHSRGGVEAMARYDLAEYGTDCVADVRDELMQAVTHAQEAGVAGDAIVLDPGLGFAKRTAHSVAILAGLARLTDLGFPVMVGPSRKRFIREIAGGAGPDDRLPGTLAACVVALLHGARLFRVHDVGPARQALDLAAATLTAQTAAAVAG
ncbi:MAG TPA: dihydropteroate synthase [Longimicrobiales bacterium]|nr:dihydropteroate synthase [Longimicrobiales bacterium]